MISETERLLGGRFALESRIGSGNYAEIFRATDSLTGNLVAIKTLKTEHAFDPHAVSLFQKEAEVGSAISHPNLVRIWSSGVEDGSHFIVMELVRGISLRRRLNLSGPLSIHESLRIMEAVLRGLDAIHHAGYVHRDIKPQNVLLDVGGTPKITDFGIALRLGEPWQLAGGLALGTAAYIAPEQAAGEEIGPQADVYSAGAVLFEMLTDEPPFPGDDPIDVMNRHLFETPRDPRMLNPDISPALAAVVLRALAKDPAERFPSAGKMREALELLEPTADLRTTTRGFLPPGQLAWTIPLAPSRRIPARLLGMPALATFVSGLLLVVLIIVLMLALVSSVVNASASQGRISSSSPPGAIAGGTPPSGDVHQSPRKDSSDPRPIPNWTTSAPSVTADPAVVAAASPTATPETNPAAVLQTSPSPTTTSAPIPTPTPPAAATPELVDVSTNDQAPIVVEPSQQSTPIDVSANQRPSDKKSADKVKERKHQGDNQQGTTDPSPPATTGQPADPPRPGKQKPGKQVLVQVLSAGSDHGDQPHGRSSGHHGHD